MLAQMRCGSPEHGTVAAVKPSSSGVLDMHEHVKSGATGRKESTRGAVEDDRSRIGGPVRRRTVQLAALVAVLRKGELQQVASPRALYEQPVNLFVAGFIGSPPMNFLPGEISGGQIELPFGTFEMPDRIAKAVGDRSLVIVGYALSASRMSDWSMTARRTRGTPSRRRST